MSTPGLSFIFPGFNLMLMKTAFYLLLFLFLMSFSSLSATDRPNTAIQATPRLDHVWDAREESWKGRHEAILKRNAEGPVDLIFLGDSITHSWTKPGEGLAIWKKVYEPLQAVNMGFGGDRTQHLLWRIQNGELDGIHPKVAVVLIGTNNWKDNTSAEIAQGITLICEEIRSRLPETKILLLAIFPRVSSEPLAGANVEMANQIIKDLHDGEWITFLDIGNAFRDEDSWLRKDLFPDGLHPNEKGYEAWANALQQPLSELLGREVPIWRNRQISPDLEPGAPEVE